MGGKQQVRAAMYVRISKDAEEQGLGVQRQITDCQNLADRKGWHITEVYEDNDISASTGKPRPAYQRMTQAIESGQIQGVVVWDVDRLTRTPRELEDVIDFADRLGLELANVGGEIDLSSPQGRMTARIKGSVARHEVEQMSRRLRRKHMELAESGKYVGPRPYGWDFNADGHLVVNKREANVIREGYRRVLAGETTYAIVKDLNGRGVPTGRGSWWRTQTFSKVLMRWINCSVRVHKGNEIGPGSWPALVSREEHERALAILSNPKRRVNPQGTKPRHLLTGLLTCARCDGPMYHVSGSVRPASYKKADGTTVWYDRTYPELYRCAPTHCGGPSQSRPHLDHYVSELVIRLMEEEGVQVVGGDSEGLRAAQEEVEAIEAKLSLIADQFTDDLITVEQFQRITEKLRPQLEAARHQVTKLTPTHVESEFTGPGVRQAWENATLDQRRNLISILRGAGLRVRVGGAGYGTKDRFRPEAITVTLPGQAELAA